MNCEVDIVKCAVNTVQCIVICKNCTAYIIQLLLSSKKYVINIAKLQCAGNIVQREICICFFNVDENIVQFVVYPLILFSVQYKVFLLKS